MSKKSTRKIRAVSAVAAALIAAFATLAAGCQQQPVGPAPNSGDGQQQQNK